MHSLSAGAFFLFTGRKYPSEVEKQPACTARTARRINNCRERLVMGGLMIIKGCRWTASTRAPPLFFCKHISMHRARRDGTNELKFPFAPLWRRRTNKQSPGASVAHASFYVKTKFSDLLVDCFFRLFENCVAQ